MCVSLRVLEQSSPFRANRLGGAGVRRRGDTVRRGAQTSRNLRLALRSESNRNSGFVAGSNAIPQRLTRSNSNFAHSGSPQAGRARPANSSANTVGSAPSNAPNPSPNCNNGTNRLAPANQAMDLTAQARGNANAAAASGAERIINPTARAAPNPNPAPRARPDAVLAPGPRPNASLAPNAGRNAGPAPGRQPNANPAPGARPEAVPAPGRQPVAFNNAFNQQIQPPDMAP